MALLIRWLPLLLVLGCGEGLVERGYRGEVRFAYSGQVTTAGRSVDFTHPLRASLFWSTETDEASLDDIWWSSRPSRCADGEAEDD